MRVVFMGTPEFAVPSLVALDDAAQVVGVFCRPDAVSGRGRRTRPGPVKLAARAHGLSGVPATHTARRRGTREPSRRSKPDLIVVAAYGLILPRDGARSRPSRRGQRPCVTAAAMAWCCADPARDSRRRRRHRRLDHAHGGGPGHGPYCLQASTPIGTAGAVELTERLALLGADALVQALPGDCRRASPRGRPRTRPSPPTPTRSPSPMSPSTRTLSRSDRPATHPRVGVRRRPCRVRVADRTVTLTAATCRRA